MYYYNIDRVGHVDHLDFFSYLGNFVLSTLQTSRPIPSSTSRLRLLIRHILTNPRIAPEAIARAGAVLDELQGALLVGLVDKMAVINGGLATSRVAVRPSPPLSSSGRAARHSYLLVLGRRFLMLPRNLRGIFDKRQLKYIGYE